MEQQSVALLNQLHPLIRQSGLDAYAESVQATPAGVHPYITEVYRSFATSDKYYAQGRTTPGAIITNSKGGQSYHNYNLAIDFVLLVDGKQHWAVDDNWMIVVNIFKKHGWTWGGDFPGTFKDYPHFEKKMGYTWQTLLAMHTNQNNFIPDTAFLKLTDNFNLA